MRVALCWCCILFPVIFFSCGKDNFIHVEGNDTLRYASFDPYAVVVCGYPFEVSIDGDRNADLYFKVEQWRDTFRNVVYDNFKCKISSLQENVMVSWGAQGSSFKYYVEYGSRISSGRFMFEDGLTIASKYHNLNYGYWDIDVRPDGYIAIKKEDDGQKFYGWVHLSVTDSSMTIKEYALGKKANEPVVAGVGL